MVLSSRPRRPLPTSCGIYKVLFLQVILGMDVDGMRFIPCASWVSYFPAHSIVAMPIMLLRLLVIASCRLLSGYGRLEGL
jgi:hypothetical protein